jgi:hypothetical protein
MMSPGIRGTSLSESKNFSSISVSIRASDYLYNCRTVKIYKAAVICNLFAASSRKFSASLDITP